MMFLIVATPTRYRHHHHHHHHPRHHSYRYQHPPHHHTICIVKIVIITVVITIIAIVFNVQQTKRQNRDKRWYGFSSKKMPKHGVRPWCRTSMKKIAANDIERHIDRVTYENLTKANPSLNLAAEKSCVRHHE